MNDFNEGLFEEVVKLANASLFAQATAEEIDRLEQLVLDNDQACRLYVDVMFDTQQLLRWSAEAATLPLPHDANPLVLPPAPHRIAPVLPEVPVNKKSEWHLPPATPLIPTSISNPISYLSGGWPLAYLIATVVFAIGAVIGTFTYVSHPVQVAVQSSVPSRPVSEPKIESVGRITCMVDCKWADPATTSVGVNVVLGRKYALASGLLEINYNTGAKVILQGPVTYEVDSAASGYLSLGKLTARVEKREEKVASGPWPVASKSETSNPQSPTPNPLLPTTHYPLFTVKTPTVTVTDLGTEFAVEVKPKGAVEVHVFQGQVETSRQVRTDAAPVKQRLVAGEAIRFVSASAAPERIPFQGSPLTTDSIRMIPKARIASQLAPVGLVATAYHRVWDVGGNLASENDRQQGFRVVTDGIFGRGENDQGPRSSFDTLDVNHAKTHFVGLLYGRLVQFDRIKIFLGRQFGDGGSWREIPRVFILKHPVDPDSTPPEDDPDNWRAMPLQLSYGPSFDAKSDANPGEVWEFVLTTSPEERTGYGWAVGGVGGDGESGYVSITELRAYGVEVSHAK